MLTPPSRRPNGPAAPPSSGLRVGFLLTPRFTLTAFAGFVDALRFAADEGDRSAQRHCQWDILGTEAIASSCGAVVAPTQSLDAVRDYDYLVVVGGLLHGGQRVPEWIRTALKRGAERGVRLVGLCTGSFVLARLGLMQGHVTCGWGSSRDAMELGAQGSLRRTLQTDWP